MVEEGCLEGVDEVYGAHQIPNFDEGDIRVKPGPVMAGTSVVKITIKGQGGHGSIPHKMKDPITAACYIMNGFNAI
jgi:hippurate hydrolase